MNLAGKRGESRASATERATVSKTRRARDSIVVLAVALAARVAVAAWGWSRFPPIADGAYYHRFADRLAHGLGYTTAWPDGTVTFAAHYPVGYPAMLAVAYAIFGSKPGVAMMVNAFVGALGALAAHRFALREASARASLLAGLAVALHPSLVFYTPAVMTEAVAASLIVVALALAPHGKTATKKMYVARIVAMGIAFGIAVLVRPQIALFAPVLAFVIAPRASLGARAASAAVALGALLATVAPWTARNCVRMNRCALVSVNGGWNLLIGVETENGSWTELRTPDACKEVWDEAAKDACFEKSARAEIAAHPLAFAARAPKKLAVTFDAFLAGPWYVHASNPKAVGERAAFVLGSIDLVASRAFLIAALAASAPLFRFRVRRRKWRTTAPRVALALAGIAFAAARAAWPAYIALAIASLISDRAERASPIRRACGVVLAATLATHAVFFGAGRYGLLVAPFVALGAFACVRPKRIAASVV